MSTMFSLWIILTIVLIGVIVTASVIGHINTVTGKKSLAIGNKTSSSNQNQTGAGLAVSDPGAEGQKKPVKNR